MRTHLRSRKNWFGSRSIVVLVLASMLVAGLASAAQALVNPVLSASVVAGPAIELDWTDGGDEDFYRIRRGASVETLTILDEVDANVLTYIDTTVTAGNTYVYRVNAINATAARKSNDVIIFVDEPDPCDVHVSPGDPLASTLNGSGSNKLFCFDAGTYSVPSTITINAGVNPTLDLTAGAVLDGQSGGHQGLVGVMNVIGGRFQHFGNAKTGTGAQPSGLVLDGGSVTGTEFTLNNNGLGIRGDGVFVDDVNIHHNETRGLTSNDPTGGFHTGVIIEDSDISFNNTALTGMGGEAGGAKLFDLDGAIIRRNDFSNNFGAGLWFDGLHTNIQVYENTATDNVRWGIFWEQAVSGIGSADIHNNTLLRNGETETTNQWGNSTQLMVTTANGGAAGINVHDNTITGSERLMGVNSHTGHPEPPRNIHFFNNTLVFTNVTQFGTQVGGRDVKSPKTLPDETTVTFENNIYDVPDVNETVKRYGWPTATSSQLFMDWTGWQNLSQTTGETRV